MVIRGLFILYKTLKREGMRESCISTCFSLGEMKLHKYILACETFGVRGGRCVLEASLPLPIVHEVSVRGAVCFRRRQYWCCNARQEATICPVQISTRSTYNNRWLFKLNILSNTLPSKH